MNKNIQQPPFLFSRLLRLIFLISISGFSNLTAQPAGSPISEKTPGQISTRIFNARDGLPDNKVQYLLEARKSPFLWAVTRNELCRFDGYRFQTVWEKMPDNDGFAENSRGELVMWNYPAGQKISVFEPNSGKKETRAVAEIAGLKGNLIRAWAQDTMLFLVLETVPGKQLEVFRLFPGFSVQHLFGIAFHFEVEGRVVPVPSNGLPEMYFDEKNQAIFYAGAIFNQNSFCFRYDLRDGKTTEFPRRNAIKGYWPRFSSLPDGTLLAYSSFDHDLWRWNVQTKDFEKINQKPGAFPGLICIGSDKKGVMVFQKKESGQSDLWLLRPDGSWLDLQKMLPKLGFTSCTGADFSRQIHFCSLEGVLRVNFERPLFSNFISPKITDRVFISPAFRGITDDRDGNIWMMGEMIGLFCRRPDGSTQQVIVREKNSGQEFYTDNALNLQTGAQGKIWSAREWNGCPNLLRIDPKTGLADTFCIKNQRISTFTLLKNGQVLLAANGEKGANLLLFDPVTRQVSMLTKSGDAENFKTSPLFLLENPEGKIWVGGKDGLLLFDPNPQINKSSNPRFLDFPGNDATAHEFPVAVIFQEKENLWLGTLGGGLRKLDFKTGKWEIFTMANGLPANKIAGILPGDGSTGSPSGSNLWISTYDGLSFFQPETRLFTNFFTQNGLSHNEFNRFSFFKNTDGTMFFGGLNGVNFFKQSEVLGSFSQGSDSLLISQISWFAPDGKTKMEQVFDLQNLQKITLPPENRFCSIRLALANFLQPEANRFAWKLEGYDENWQLNGTNNEITFHYLPAGKYRLRIKAANPTGIWGKNERVLEIEVREFWYKTGWFLAFFIAAIGIFSYLYYRYEIRQKLEHAENAKIKELDLLRTRLYTNITHEFRTPLTVILGMADQIRGHENERKLISRNGQNLLRLINQLLDLSKLDSGMMKMNPVQGDIINYLQYLTESFYSMAQEKQVRLTFYPEIPELTMDFDEEKVQHIVYNLLSNALKFTPSGGKVVLHASKINENGLPFLKLKIQDTGVGIAENQLAHIFDRFFQADNSATRKSEGTGIGLALTKELVGLMGGSISVESSVGKGSVFTVLLPVKLESGLQKTEQKLGAIPKISPDFFVGEDANNGKKSENKTAETIENQKLNVEKPLLLVIEDNPDVITYIVGILKNDYEIEVANNGKTGIEKALEIVPDIIISDVMMPEKDGYEVCETLKTDERTSHIPIILLTAKATQEDKLAGLRVGADAYLQKPFDKTELFVRLEKLVALRKSLQNRYANFSKISPENNSKTATPPSLDDIFLQKIRQVILEKMGDSELGIVHLCRAASLSHTQVFRKLKALTGENPTLFIRKMRLERGLELLKTTELNVSEIAYEVGFSDPNYFSRSFHEEFGVTPGAMRK